ncbi:dehydrogenase/reductase SDR family member 4 [Reticulomyxa filosa]|uniref:Dehydrogenase/reductase SDR family member 4 n=1 Tax=Reticulomyxa filosa TaxID=46433 RepID=X6LYM2_RETFI|nr:dehydrogenase/reductase SDR family member 4 [Reticulomyxa filosa]|eukprot:ETO06729.1 dehydrogenase/reductase SDR family member 4 [Reticulomyxa filosa]
MLFLFCNFFENKNYDQRSNVFAFYQRDLLLSADELFYLLEQFFPFDMFNLQNSVPRPVKFHFALKHPLKKKKKNNNNNNKMSSRFAGKVAVVTGSTAGIGKAIAHRLAEEGATVVITSRKAESVEKEVKELTSKGRKAVGMASHQGSVADVQKLIDFVISKCGRLDIVVVNAASNVHFGSMMSATEKQWVYFFFFFLVILYFCKIFEVNVKGSFFLVQKAHPHLKKVKGSVVLVSSIGAYESEPTLGIYNASKTALLGLTHGLSKELGRDGIRVNCIAPGLIPTKFSDALVSNKIARDLMVSRTSLNRLGTPEDCAGVVAFLCSEDAAYITGETIAIAGGTRSRL